MNLQRPQRVPPPTHKQRADAAGRLMCRSRAQALLLSARCGVPRPTTNWANGPHGHQHIARPSKHIPRTVGECINPHEVLRSVLQPGDRGPANTDPARARVQITFGEVGYHLGLADHGCNALNLRHTHRPHTDRSRPRQTERPRPVATRRPHLRLMRHPKESLACRPFSSPEYPSLTTDQEVHQVRTRICKILSGAAVDRKIYVTKLTQHHM